MDSFRLPPGGPMMTHGSQSPPAAAGEGPGGGPGAGAASVGGGLGGAGGSTGRGLVYVYVLHGRVQLRSRRREAFAPRLAPRGATQLEPAADAAAAGTTAAASGGPAAGPVDGSAGGGVAGLEKVTEQEMLALFKHIDTDGSGAITVSELQVAMELMGVHKSKEEVAELMEGVDADGSGEMEFVEFKAVLRKAIRARSGAPAPTEWKELGGGVWFRDLPSGCWVGEAAMLDPAPVPQEGVLLALDSSDLLVLERCDYEYILENGFDGELQAKMALLRNSAVLAESLRRTDLRRLAYAMERRTVPMNRAVYEQGQPPTSLELILEGHCKLVVRMTCEKSPATTTTATTTITTAAILAPAAVSLRAAASLEPPPPSPPAAAAGGGGAASRPSGRQTSESGSDSEEPSEADADATVAAGVPPPAEPLPVVLPADLDSRSVYGGAAALMMRGGKHPHLARRGGGRTKRLELAVLGPGDMCSEAAVLGDGRQPHTCFVTSSGGLVTLSLALRDLRKLVHPADLAVLREHARRRLAQRANRLAAAAAVANLTPADLGRQLSRRQGLLQPPPPPPQQQQPQLRPGAVPGEGRGPGMVRRKSVRLLTPRQSDAEGIEGGGGGGGDDSEGRSFRRAVSSVMDGGGRGGGCGGGCPGLVGRGELPRPGTTDAALSRVAALVRGKARTRATARASDDGGSGAGGPSELVRQAVAALLAESGADGGGGDAAVLSYGAGVAAVMSATVAERSSHDISACSSSSDLFGLNGLSYRSGGSVRRRRSMEQQFGLEASSSSLPPPRPWPQPAPELSGPSRDGSTSPCRSRTFTTATSTGGTSVGPWGSDPPMMLLVPAASESIRYTAVYTAATSGGGRVHGNGVGGAGGAAAATSLDRILAALDAPSVACRSGIRVVGRTTAKAAAPAAVAPGKRAPPPAQPAAAAPATVRMRVGAQVLLTAPTRPLMLGPVYGEACRMQLPYEVLGPISGCGCGGQSCGAPGPGQTILAEDGENAKEEETAAAEVEVGSDGRVIGFTAAAGGGGAGTVGGGGECEDAGHQHQHKRRQHASDRENRLRTTPCKHHHFTTQRAAPAALAARGSSVGKWQPPSLPLLPPRTPVDGGGGNGGGSGGGAAAAATAAGTSTHEATADASSGVADSTLGADGSGGSAASATSTLHVPPLDLAKVAAVKGGAGSPQCGRATTTLIASSAPCPTALPELPHTHPHPYPHPHPHMHPPQPVPQAHGGPAAAGDGGSGGGEDIHARAAGCNSPGHGSSSSICRSGSSRGGASSSSAGDGAATAPCSICENDYGDGGSGGTVMPYDPLSLEASHAESSDDESTAAAAVAVMATEFPPPMKTYGSVSPQTPPPAPTAKLPAATGPRRNAVPAMSVAAVVATTAATSSPSPPSSRSCLGRSVAPRRAWNTPRLADKASGGAAAAPVVAAASASAPNPVVQAVQEGQQVAARRDLAGAASSSGKAAAAAAAAPSPSVPQRPSPKAAKPPQQQPPPPQYPQQPQSQPQKGKPPAKEQSQPLRPSLFEPELEASLRTASRTAQQLLSPLQTKLAAAPAQRTEEARKLLHSCHKYGEYRRGVDSTNTPPPTPPVPYSRHRTSLTGRAHGSSRDGGGGGGRGNSDGGVGGGGDEDEYDDDDDWDTPLVPYTVAPAATAVVEAAAGSSPLSPLSSSGQAERGASAPNYQVGIAGSTAAPKQPQQSRDPTVAPKLESQPPPRPPPPPPVPRLGLHKLQLGGSSGGSAAIADAAVAQSPRPSAARGSQSARAEWAASLIPGGGGGGGQSGSLTARADWAGGGGGAAADASALTSRHSVVRSVKSLLRGWRTAREAASYSSGGASTGSYGSGGASGGVDTAAPPPLPLPDQNAPAPSAPTAAVNGWSREAVVAALAVAGGERGRLASIYTGMLRHGEAAVRPSLEYAILLRQLQNQNHKQQQRQSSSGPAATAAAALVPRPAVTAAAAIAVKLRGSGGGTSGGSGGGGGDGFGGWAHSRAAAVAADVTPRRSPPGRVSARSPRR